MSSPPVVFEFDALGAGDGQSDTIHAPRLVGSAVLAQPGPGEPLDAAEFLAVDRRERSAETRRAAGLDLAEDDDLREAGHEVDLAEPVPPVAVEQLHPVPPQMRRRQPLADAAELARADVPQRHGPAPPGRGSSRTWPAPKSRSGSR
ncbi:hypothetical protein GCM10028833_10720 [Glycomyces tarimensis]